MFDVTEKSQFIRTVAYHKFLTSGGRFWLKTGLQGAYFSLGL